MRVTLVDGRVLAFREAGVVGDSLTGRPDLPAARGARATVAVADVRAVAVRRVSAGRTAALLAGAAAVAAAVWVALAYLTLSTAST